MGGIDLGQSRGVPDPITDIDQPGVSMILTTRDRPRFLQIALRCFLHQTYPNKELVVVDDGLHFPVDADQIEALGGRIVRMPHGASIGAKLNAGIAVARGPLCQKMDDDDWYGPAFLQTMIRHRLAALHNRCVPMMTFVMPFLFFVLATWDVRRTIDTNVPGATLMFDKDDWAERPFRDLSTDEDVLFFHDQRRLGRHVSWVSEIEIFTAVRHSGISGDRSHTWTRHHSWMSLEQYIDSRPLHHLQPEDYMPEWARHAYRELRADLMFDPRSRE